MKLIQEFTPNEIHSSVGLASRLNELVRAVNSVLADPEKAKKDLEMIAKRDQELLKLDQTTRSPELKPFSGLRSVSRQELNRVALRYDVLEPEKISDPEEVIRLIANSVERYRSMGSGKKEVELPKKDGQKSGKPSKVDKKEIKNVSPVASDIDLGIKEMI